MHDWKGVAPQTEVGSDNLLSDLVRDVRHGLRGIARAPGFTFFAILTLALGIGATTTVFTIVNTMLLHPLPVADPSRLVCVYTTDVKTQKQSGSLLPTSYLNLKDYQARNTAFSDMGGFSPPLVLTLTENANSERFFGQLVTAGYFEALGIAPVKGDSSAPQRSAQRAARPWPC